MDFEKILQESGLTIAESKVFIALKKLNQSKSGKIISLTGLQSSVVHNSLNTLIEKGLISFVLVGGFKEYIAGNTNLLLENIRKTEAELDKAIPAIEKLSNLDTDTATSEIFIGKKGLIAAVEKMTSVKIKGEIYRYFGINESQSNADIIEFFEKLDLINSDRKIKIEGVASKQSKSLYEYNKSKIYFVSSEIPPAMNIYGDYVLQYSFSGKITGILIHSKEIASQYKEFWNNLKRAS